MITSKCTIPTSKNSTKYKKVYQSRYTFTSEQKNQEITQAQRRSESIRKYDVINQNKLVDKKQSPRVSDLHHVLKTKTKIREGITSNVSISESDGDNINDRVVDVENMKQNVRHDTNDNIHVKDDVVSSPIDKDSKDVNINNINKDKYSILHVDMWDNTTKATTATTDKISVAKYFKAANEHEKHETIEYKRLDEPYISSDTDLSKCIINLNIATKKYDKQIEIEIITAKEKRRQTSEDNGKENFPRIKNEQVIGVNTINNQLVKESCCVFVVSCCVVLHCVVI